MILNAIFHQHDDSTQLKSNQIQVLVLSDFPSIEADDPISQRNMFLNQNQDLQQQYRALRNGDAFECLCWNRVMECNWYAERTQSIHDYHRIQ